MQRQGYSKCTIHFEVRALHGLARRVDLREPELVKEHLALRGCSESRKLRLVYELIRYYKWKGVRFDPPHYRQVDRLPFIPLESEIDALISGCGPKTATLLLLLKETGMRVGEAWSAKWTDLDLHRNLIIVRPEKGSNSRALKISDRLISMLNLLPKDSQFIFRQLDQDPITSLIYARRNFERQRKQLAEKLQNPVNADSLPYIETFQGYNGISENQRHTPRNASIRPSEYRTHFTLHSPSRFHIR